MKILEIEINNTKTLKAFNKTLNGDNMEVAGPTGSGKTTAISCLWDILEKHGDMITHGKRKGSIRVKLGEGDQSIIAERKYTPSGSTIDLTMYDGEDPKAISIGDFRKMVSKLSVDPHKIMQMGPTERIRTLMAAAHIEIDLEELDRKIADAENDRLIEFRHMEAVEPSDDEPEKVAPVSTVALFKERQELQDHNAKTLQLRADSIKAEKRSEEIGIQIKENEAEIGQLEEQIKALREKNRIAGTQKSDYAKEYADLKNKADANGLKDLSDVDARIEKCDEINEKAAIYKRYHEEKKRYEKAKEDHLEAFRYVNELRDTKKSALENAQWPLKGLSIEDGEIYYKECLLSNLGQSEQMLVTAALAIADIEKHVVKVVRMDCVESMSKEDFIVLQKLFNTHGIQVLSTRVSRSDIEPQELVIVDGEYSDENQ